jgi:hypothetical protein
MRRLVALLTISAILSSCFVFRRVDVRPVDTQEGTRVTSPVKAHLKDGSTIVYPSGLIVSGGYLQGAGDRYDLTLTRTGVVDSVPLDQVIGMESFRTRVEFDKTVVVSTLASIGITFAAAGLAIAIFGSCPTVYSGKNVEEAELFSTSVAPLFEGRDLDRLQAKADAGGAVRLEIRNEAMETHYLNHLQLLDGSEESSRGSPPGTDAARRRILSGRARDLSSDHLTASGSTTRSSESSCSSASTTAIAIKPIPARHSSPTVYVPVRSLRRPMA